MRRRLLHKLFLLLLTIPAFLFIFLPVIWLIISSISTRAELLNTPIHWIPENPTLRNYLDILTPGTAASEVASTFKVTLKNSLIVSACVTAITLVFGSLAAFALARINFPFRRALLLWILGVRMIPEISLVIPLYLLAARLDQLNKLPVLIVTYLSFSLPFGIWLLASFFQTIPKELEDSARIDGCTPFSTLWRVILPISAPGMVSTGIFVFLLAWDEFFFALIFTSTIAAKTVPVAIAEFTGRYVVDISSMMAGGILAAIPPVLLSLIFQRYIVSGLTTGAVKG